MLTLYRWLYYLLPANPMVVRVVQGGSRRMRHLSVRMGYLGVLVLVMLFGLLSGGGLTGNQSLTQLAKAGTWVFVIVSYWQIGLICLLAPLFMAGAIAAEQSGKTYEILLTTPLSNLQIVLGSLLGRLYFVLALLASGLPLFAVLLIFGGVPIQSVFVSFAVAALTTLLVGAMAITLAVLRTGGRKAVFLFVIATVGYLVATYTLDAFLLRGNAPPLPDGTTWLTPLHPLLVLEASFNGAHYRVPPAEILAAYPSLPRFYLGHPFGTFAILTGSLSLFLILWSAIRLRRLVQGESSVLGWWSRLGLWGGGGERRRTPREVWTNPVAWREARTRGNRTARLLGRGLFVVVGLGAAAALLVMYHQGKLTLTDGSGRVVTEGGVVFQWALLTLLWIELATVVTVATYMSAGSISKEREDGTLDLLLTTPITPRKYLWGKLHGLVSFLGVLLAVPILTLAMVSTYTVVGLKLGWPQAEMSRSFATAQGQMIMREALVLPAAPFLWALVIVPFVAVCAMTGMSWSLKSKGVLGAVVPAVAILGGLTLVFGFCGISAARGVPFVGPFLNALSPVTSLLMFTDPWTQVSQYNTDASTGLIILILAALLAAGLYGMIVYTLVTGMEKGFDKTVRRLTGAG